MRVMRPTVTICGDSGLEDAGNGRYCNHQKIRERVGEDVTIIILTSFDFSEIEEEARAAGVNAFMANHCSVPV